MPAVSLLIKPASGNCNMRCRYCFYEDITNKRETPSYGIMQLDTLEAVVKKSLERATIECRFMFQGGEPTLAGLPFFEKLIEFVARYNVKRVPVSYGLQTNGYVIDENWAAYLKQHRYLVGLSLDGTKDVHDRYRRDAAGEGTYKRTMHAAQLFDKYGVDYNLLTVVTAKTARSIGKIYGFYKRSGFKYQQYIPCLDPLGEERGGHEYSLTPKLYTQFLKSLFDVWYQDMRRGEQVYNRYFENLAGMLAGGEPESCCQRGHCSNQYVVEADGGVYPCDFYVLDRYRLGNLVTDSFEELDKNYRSCGFFEESLQREEQCEACRWLPLCRGGCRRDREPLPPEGTAHNYFCESYQEFFEYAVPRLTILLQQRR